MHLHLVILTFFFLLAAVYSNPLSKSNVLGPAKSYTPAPSASPTPVPAADVERWLRETNQVHSAAPPEDIQYICETTGGSPRVVDVYGAAHALGNRPGVCGPYNAPWYCMNTVYHRTAVLAVCRVKLRPAPLSCYQQTWWSIYLAQRCGWNGLAGGKVLFDERGWHILVYHSGGS